MNLLKAIERTLTAIKRTPLAIKYEYSKQQNKNPQSK